MVFAPDMLSTQSKALRLRW